MAHELTYTHFPPPSEFPIRPSTHVIDTVKLKGMMKGKTHIGMLAELSWLLRIRRPEYTVWVTWDNHFFSTVKFAKQEFTSSSLRTWKPDAMQDAAGLAFDGFLNNPSTFSYITIPEVMPTISSISALEDLCQEKDWKVTFEITGSKEDGWRCGVSVVMGEEIATLEEGDTFLTKRDAKRDAAMVTYNWLKE